MASNELPRQWLGRAAAWFMIAAGTIGALATVSAGATAHHPHAWSAVVVIFAALSLAVLGEGLRRRLNWEYHLAWRAAYPDEVRRIEASLPTGAIVLPRRSSQGW